MRSVPGARLTLEPQIEAHADEMFAVLQDPAIYAYENEAPVSVEWLRDRFRKLESRASVDGQELWLNWVLRLSTSELIGFVQATVRPDGSAAIAYVLASKCWGRGLANEAVKAMMNELAEHYTVRSVSAVLKRDNLRSIRLLERLGFTLVSAEMHALQEIEADEILMQRKAQ